MIFEDGSVSITEDEVTKDEVKETTSMICFIPGVVTHSVGYFGEIKKENSDDT